MLVEERTHGADEESRNLRQRVFYKVILQLLRQLKNGGQLTGYYLIRGDIEST